MEAISRILDARNEPLRMSQDYAKELYEVCERHLHNTSWSAAELRPWVDVFLRMDEEDMAVLLAATEDPKPWKPFLRLCMSMTAYVVSHNDYPTSIELQTIHKQLSEGRRRLRVSAMCYADLYSTDMDRDLRRAALLDAPASMADGVEEIVRRKGRR